MRSVRIYQPSKTAMQSGNGKTREGDRNWVLESHPSENPPLRLIFPTPQEAAAYAQARGYAFTVDIAQKRMVRPANYGENFMCQRLRGGDS